MQQYACGSFLQGVSFRALPIVRDNFKNLLQAYQGLLLLIVNTRTGTTYNSSADKSSMIAWRCVLPTCFLLSVAQQFEPELQRVSAP